MARFGARDRRERELDDEIRAHLEMAIQARVDRGESRAEAERAVRREFGNVARVKEVTRSSWGGMWLDRLRQDLRLAIRSLRRKPGFAATAILTLALGVGSGAAVFGIAEQILLRPLPGVEHTGSAAYLELAGPETLPGNSVAINQATVESIRERASLLEGFASWVNFTTVVEPVGGGPERISANLIYGDFFEVLGVTPAAGRLMTPDETVPTADPNVVVISERLRDRIFGSEVDPVGRSIDFDGQLFTVLGVTGDGFAGPGRSSTDDAWFPWSAFITVLGQSLESLQDPERTSHNNLVVRPAEGVPFEAARTQLREILVNLGASQVPGAERLTELRPVLYEGLHVRPVSRAGTERFLRLLAIAAALLLAIACANVANLLLFRNLTRRGELGVRRALGASSLRLARLHLTESLVLATAGAVCGLGVAWGIGEAFQEERMGGLMFEGFSLDWPTLAFVSGAALVSSLVFGTLPALLAGRFDMRSALGASRPTDTGRLRMLRLGLSTGQIALTLSIVVGGLLMAQTLRNLRDVATGVDVEGVSMMYFGLRTDGDSISTESRRTLLGELVRAIEGIPGVESAALDMYGPHGSRAIARVSPVGADADLQATVAYWPVAPGWFELFGIEPLYGRTFEDSDWSSSPADGVVLTASLAERLFGRSDVVGQMVNTGMFERRDRRVVGVVPEYRSIASPEAPTDVVFVPYGEHPGFGGEALMVRAAGLDPNLNDRLQATFASVLPHTPVPDALPLTDRVRSLIGAERMLGRLLWLLSGFGLLMSAVGLYGVIAFAVSTRTREFGVRMALGAQGSRIARMVLRDAGGIVVAGLVIGLGGAYALSQLLQSQLFGVEPFDPLLYAVAAAILATAAFVASLAPARMATRVDPIATLKEE